MSSWRTLTDWRIVLSRHIQLRRARRRGGLQAPRRCDRGAAKSAETNWPAYRRADASFHLTLARGVGQRARRRAMTELHSAFSDLSASPPADRTAARPHAAPPHSLAARRDAAGAAAAMREHLLGSERIIEGLLANADLRLVAGAARWARTASLLRPRVSSTSSTASGARARTPSRTCETSTMLRGAGDVLQHRRERSRAVGERS